MKDPVRVFASMEREDHAELKEIAKSEGRPLYEMIRVILKNFVRGWKEAKSEDEVSPEDRYG